MWAFREMILDPDNLKNIIYPFRSIFSFKKSKTDNVFTRTKPYTWKKGIQFWQVAPLLSLTLKHVGLEDSGSWSPYIFKLPSLEMMHNGHLKVSFLSLSKKWMHRAIPVASNPSYINNNIIQSFFKVIEGL